MCPIISRLHKRFPNSRFLQYAMSISECEPKKILKTDLKSPDSLPLKYEDPLVYWNFCVLIGIGAFGKIFQAENIQDGTKAAVKVISASDFYDVDRLFIEIEIMRKCNHKNIIKLRDAFIYDSKIYIIMEFCEFGSLDSIMTKLERNLTEEEIRNIVTQILEALVYLHETVYVIHRDVKAANILLNKNGEIKLIDFGISAKNWYLEQNKTTFAGSPHWVSPEVVSCKEEIFKTYNNKVDIWSLGITCIELAEKLPPNNWLRPKDAMKKIYEDNSPGLQEPQKWSIEFKDFISKCLTKSPKKRPNASELLKVCYIIFFVLKFFKLNFSIHLLILK